MTTDFVKAHNTTSLHPQQASEMASVALSNFFVDRRLETIYKAMNSDNIQKAISVINDTLRAMNGAKWVDADPDWDIKTHNYILEKLYISLVDIAMGRNTAAQTKLRDCHYYLLKVDMDKYDDTDIQDNLFEVLSASDAATDVPSDTIESSESESERDAELEDLINTLFGTA
jgi:hypothetical protein